MSYEILSAYADCSEISYAEISTGEQYTPEVWDRVYAAMSNAAIRLAGMTPGDWIYSNMWGDTIRTARYATLEGFPFKFIAAASLFDTAHRDVELTIEYNKKHFYFMRFWNIYMLHSELEFKDKLPYGGVSEKIIDIDGGIHYNSIDIKYDGSGPNKRIYSGYITKVYDLNTDEIFGWAIGTGNEYASNSVIIKESTGEYYQQSSNVKDATRMRYDMFQSNEYIIDRNQLVLSTKVINDKYYTLGNGESVTQYYPIGCLFTEKNNEEAQNQNMVIQNKIRLPNFYEEKDLYLIKTPISTIAYTKDN